VGGEDVEARVAGVGVRQRHLRLRGGGRGQAVSGWAGASGEKARADAIRGEERGWRARLEASPQNHPGQEGLFPYAVQGP
jgi:hypothetical protein